MASDWMKWVKGLERRGEVMRIARATKLSHWDAAARCMGVWAWTDDESTDGTIAGVDLSMIDDVVGKRGFGQAMKDAGWVIENNGLTFPNWDRHNSSTSKGRAQDARRKRNGYEPENIRNRTGGFSGSEQE